jgi:hypothetical protein
MSSSLRACGFGEPDFFFGDVGELGDGRNTGEAGIG